MRDALDAVGLGQAARSCAADLTKRGVKAETDLASLTDEAYYYYVNPGMVII